MIDPHQPACASLTQSRQSCGNNHDYVRGNTWTTDALYRETRPRMARRQSEGCVVVDMEAAAFFAVARFRRVEFAQILYGGGSLAGQP